MIDRRSNGETDRFEVEAARWFFMNSEDVFVIIHDGVIQRVSPAWSRITGWKGDDAVGADFRTFLHADDADVLAESLTLLESVGQTNTEHRLKAASGEWLWMRSWARRARGGSSLVVLTDITEMRRRKLAAESAARTNEMLRTTAGVFMWQFDPETGIYTVDSDLPPQAPGKENGSHTRSMAEMNTMVHPDDVAMVRSTFSASMATGEAAIVHYRQYNSLRGTWLQCRTAWRGLRPTASGKWELVGITQDVTELSDARDAAIGGEQRAQEAAESKAQFVANMSHEIRTPLNGVLGVLHLLKAEALSVDGRRMLEEALGCGDMLTALLNDVIDFSRIDEGRLELSPQPVDPVVLLTSVTDLLRQGAEDRGLYLRVRAPLDLGWVEIDPVRLRQVLFNLIGNAVKFTRAGGVEIRAMACQAASGPGLRFEIEDTGIGIPQEAQAGLFERFHQADGSTTRQFGGSGLGLAITRRLAKLMGGEAGFESRAGRGSTFWVEIAASPAMPVAGEIEPDATPLSGLRVLVVEDNPTNRMIVTRMLEQLGMQVETAENGAVGLEAASRSAFDLILMDVQMPVMDGVEASRRIRALPGLMGSVPIIAMTANVLAHQRRTYAEAGMSTAISKPMSPAALVQGVIAALSDADAARAEAAA